MSLACAVLSVMFSLSLTHTHIHQYRRLLIFASAPQSKRRRSFRKCFRWVSAAELSAAKNTSLPYFSKLAATPPAVQCSSARKNMNNKVSNLRQQGW